MTWSLIWEHLFIVLASAMLSVAIGLPLGIWAYVSPKARAVILRVVDLLQTIPSLALLGIIVKERIEHLSMLGIAYQPTNRMHITDIPPPRNNPERRKVNTAAFLMHNLVPNARLHRITVLRQNKIAETSLHKLQQFL